MATAIDSKRWETGGEGFRAWAVRDYCDTRETDLETRKPISNSGEDRCCDRCGANHQVWVTVVATVREADGEVSPGWPKWRRVEVDRAVVGKTCAKAIGASKPSWMRL